MKPLLRHTSEPIKDKPVKGHRIGMKLVGRTGLHAWKPSKHKGHTAEGAACRHCNGEGWTMHTLGYNYRQRVACTACNGTSRTK